MQKLSKSNLAAHMGIRRAEGAIALGMAALWMSLYKRLLYPVMFTYYRTGSDAALHAQAAYAAAVVVVAAALLLDHARLGRQLVAHRWIAAIVGIIGALGIDMISPGAFFAGDGGQATLVGSMLVAAYLPVHVAFWALYVHAWRTGAGRHQAGIRGGKAVACSVALFAIAAIAFSVLGIQNVYVSVACPVVSSFMCMLCPKLEPGAPSAEAAAEATHDGEPASEPATSEEQAGELHSYVQAPDGTTTAKTAPAAPEADFPASAHDQNAMPADAAPSPESDDALLAAFADHFGLSKREAELALHTYRNHTARQIAGELFIAESTVYTHQKRIYRKTGVHSKQELIELIDSWKSGLEILS